MDELRVQGEGGVGVVGIGIRPRAGHRGVVDRQDLDDALTSGRGPVNQLFQILELADSEAAFAAEGEDRDRGAGPAPGSAR